MGTRLRIYELAAILVAITMLAVAAKLTVSRKEGSAVIYKSYSELYELHDLPRISSLLYEAGGKLGMVVENLNSQAWKVTRQDGAHSLVQGPGLSIDLEPGLTRYLVAADDGRRTFTFRVFWDPESGNPVVSDTSIPLRSRPSLSREDFVVSPNDVSDDDLSRARAILKYSGVQEDDSSVQKILKIASFLHESLMPHRGVPSPHMRYLHALDQYDEALAGRSDVYCANHAEIYAFLATIAGVPTRLVDVGGEFDGVALGAHAFAESYVDELGQWAYVDLQLSVGIVHDANGRVLSGADILLRNHSGSSDGLTAHAISDGRTQEIPYADVMPLIQQFISGRSTLTYLWGTQDRFSIGQRLYRLLLRPQPAFSLEHSRNIAAWRLTAAYLFLTASLFLFLVLVRRITQPRKTKISSESSLSP